MVICYRYEAQPGELRYSRNAVLCLKSLHPRSACISYKLSPASPYFFSNKVIGSWGWEKARVVIVMRSTSAEMSLIRLSGVVCR